MRTTLTILAGALAIVALGHTLRADPEVPKPRAATPGPPVVLGATSPADPSQSSAMADEAAQPDSRAPTATARRVGRRFLAALLRWEAGDEDPLVGEQLQTTASPRLWTNLNSERRHPTQAPDGVSRAELISAIRATTGPRRAAMLAARVRRGSTPSGLALVLRKRDGRWQVTGLQR